ncbi:MAG: LysM peptidoglycan-binding domain-containing M23 family metallopeptidase [Myxococcota bacterium]|nr:LysM peptidoglycan-binding domain-containing M23 family metallopeptidase [Myxococcota bacterium]
MAALSLTGFASCASDSSSGTQLRREGSHHTVRKGENLYRIGRRYGIPAEVIREANDIRDVTTLRVGQRLWIPAAGRAGASGSLARRLRSDVRKETGIDFKWPVQGKLTSRYGKRGRSPHEGIDIGAPRGTDIYAAESGKVVHVGRMGDYGKLVIVKHAGDYRSVYAHVNRYHVRKGNFVEKGQRIAEVGATGNASGPHLHFEIRERDRPRDPMLYLP